MDIQVLISTMHQNGHELLKKMNIQSNAIVINQCDRNEIEKVFFENYEILWISCKDRGVGLSRNIALFHAQADICIVADDDMVFHDGYPKDIIESFENNPNTDVLILNLECATPWRRINRKVQRVFYHNYMNYGAARIVFRRKSISYFNLTFNLNFGGGTSHSCGEDTLFIRDCIKNKLVIKTIPLAIASLEDARPSTWFNGYSNKYFYDYGIFCALCFSNSAKIIGKLLIVKNKNRLIGEVSLTEAFTQFDKGVQFIKRKKYLDKQN